MISINVVTKGPIEIARSILSSSNKRVRTDATKQAILMEVEMELPKTMPNIKDE